MKPIKINFLAQMILRWSSRRFFKTEAFSLIQRLKESRKVLICMPARIDYFALAKESLSNFMEIFHGKAIFIFLPFLKTDGYLPTPTGYDVIYPRKEDLKIFSLPKKRLVQKIREHQFDVSLDLDLEDGFFNGYLCLKCKTPLRIGSKRKNGFPFYNLQLAVEQKRAANREVYESMAKMLKDLLLHNGATKTHNI